MGGIQRRLKLCSHCAKRVTRKKQINHPAIAPLFPPPLPLHSFPSYYGELTRAINSDELCGLSTGLSWRLPLNVCQREEAAQLCIQPNRHCKGGGGGGGGAVSCQGCSPRRPRSVPTVSFPASRLSFQESPTTLLVAAGRKR